MLTLASICTGLWQFQCSSFVAFTVTGTALMQLHLVSSMHTAFTTDSVVHSGSQSPPHLSSNPIVMVQAELYFEVSPIHDQLGILHIFHAGISLLLWWSVTYLTVTETSVSLRHWHGWMSMNVCTNDQYPGVCTGDIMLQFCKDVCKR